MGAASPMTPLPLIVATCAGATASLICVCTLPLTGYDTTTGLWLTIIGIAAGLVSIVSAVLAIAALTPAQPLTVPWKPTEPEPPIVTARVIRPALERPVLALPAGEPT